MWCKEEYATKATYRMQLATDKLNSWTEKSCVAVKKGKSSTTLFTLSPKQKAGTITLGGTPLKNEEATYLGITFNKRQTWKPHIAKAEAKARRRLAILRKRAGTTWGASEKILKTVYQGTVRPHLKYGSSVWSTTAKTNQQALDKVQNQALRLTTGAMRSTPITEMERLTGVQPLGQRRDAKNMMQAEKCLTNHPLKNQAGKSHQESAEKKKFCPKEQEAEPPVSRQTAPEHTSLLPTRHVRALGNGHNWHQGPYDSPFPL